MCVARVQPPAFKAACGLRKTIGSNSSFSSSSLCAAMEVLDLVRGLRAERLEFGV